jgi:phosphoribosylaminoimidazole-succinocarboxamide synthase
MNFAAIATALPVEARTSFTGLPLPLLASGKVREIFDLGDALLLVASDRLSAFDVIMPDGIPGKGIILTQMSLWWFAQTRHLIQNHLLPDQAGEFARRGLHDRDLQLRSMIVRKLKPLTIECVARGYLIGSGWSSYQKSGEV